MVQTVVLRLALGVDIPRLGQSLTEVVPRPISVLYSLGTDQRLDCFWTVLVACIRVSIGVLVLLAAGVGVGVVFLLEFLGRAGWFNGQLLACTPLVVLLHAESVYHSFKC